MKRKQFFIRDDQNAFLENLPGKVSEHIRRAIDEYIQKKKNANVSESSSKGGTKNG